MRKTALYLCITAFYLTLFACSKKQAEELKPEINTGSVTKANVSYNNYVGALLTTKCNNCHGPNGGQKGTWLFNGIQSVTGDTRVKTTTLVTMNMPLGSSLTAQEKQLLTAWYDRGMPAN
ncbi:hypothetical protein OC25_02745 [Pedobacter kyungheensis]|uniref:Cytochrome c domain-containing protein n=1 Tax=Pedobacter kyungheensis TaxID=1069985 RepID=A0A0C1DGC8_9SPHI|nr:hypothetical protein [Pedobacter kyungheensis]KIA96656.1 hypothetical protein OC25_02745 [Pedobacter kyungheensis]